MRNSNNTDMRNEYDFSGGVRGKHYKAYRKGHAIYINKDNGSTSVQYFTQEDGSVMLDPDTAINVPNGIDNLLEKKANIWFYRYGSKKKAQKIKNSELFLGQFY